MTAAELRALADRVEKEQSSIELLRAIAATLGIAVDETVGCFLPSFTTSRDDVAALEKGEWETQITRRQMLVSVVIWPSRDLDARRIGEGHAAGDHAEPRARLAAVLRALAAEKDAQP